MFTVWDLTFNLIIGFIAGYGLKAVIASLGGFKNLWGM